MKSAKGIYAGLLVVAIGWVAAIFAAPRLMCNGAEWAGLILYRVFALICHQRSERSFHWCDWPLAVCVRCTGIYAGALLGMLLYPFWASLDTLRIPARHYLILTLALLAVDWTLGAVGIFVHNTGSRLITGALAGIAGAFYVLPGLLLVLRPVSAKQI